MECNEVIELRSPASQDDDVFLVLRGSRYKG